MIATDQTNLSKPSLEVQSADHKRRSPVKIGLMSPFGRSNLGDLATQQAMIQNIRKYHPDAQIFGFSLHPEDTEKRYGIPSFPITRLGETQEWWLGKQPNYFITFLHKIVQACRAIPNPVIKKAMYPILGLSALLLELLAVLRAYQHIGGFDLFIVSGGGQLDDYWWGARFHPYTLFLWSTLAKLRKVKFAFVSVGAGPIDSQLSKLLIRYALANAAYRSYRDEDSKQYIARVVNFHADDPVYPDLAHSLQVDHYRTLSTQKNAQPIVGINPMSSYFDRHGEAAYWNYLNQLAEFVAWLLQKQYRILFFPGCIDGDTPAMADLKMILDRNGVTYSDQQILQPPIETVDEQVAQLSCVDMVIASRFHGVLMPLTLHKPVLALSYHPKIDMLMQHMGQADSCLSLYDFDADAMKTQFEAIESNFELIKQQLADRVQDYKVALDEQYERLFRSL